MEYALLQANKVRLGGLVGTKGWSATIFNELVKLGCQKRFKNANALERWFLLQFEASRKTCAMDIFYKAVLGPGDLRPLTKEEIDNI